MEPPAHFLPPVLFLDREDGVVRVPDLLVLRVVSDRLLNRPRSIRELLEALEVHQAQSCLLDSQNASQQNSLVLFLDRPVLHNLVPVETLNTFGRQRFQLQGAEFLSIQSNIWIQELQHVILFQVVNWRLTLLKAIFKIQIQRINHKT